MNNELTRAYIIDLYNNPLNYGKLKDFDFSKKGENPLCGDSITIYIKIKKDKIENISFEAQGCIISNVSASILTKEVKGMTLKDFKENFKFESVKEKLLLDLSFSREKCARLSFDILVSLLKDNII
jgi:nitrogen fixation NifU-like protein